jgi:carbonic anhydrase
MDARLAAKYAGLAEGDTHVIRNVGGRASDDAIHLLVISWHKRMVCYPPYRLRNGNIQ